jgi:siroheme synthase (precorrin-2 oxidase/ferrochelatase)
MQTRTEYAIRLTAARHGKWQTLIEALPDDHKADREWAEQRVADRRAWQADAGRTPDAELVTRTHTITDWKA